MFKSRNIEINTQVKAKLAASTVRQIVSLNLHQIEFTRIQLFCLAVGYLQLTVVK